MTHLGLSLAHNDQFEKAKEVLEDALRISQEVNYPSNIARTYHFIGSLYSMQHLHEAAESNYIRAIELFTELGLQHHIAGVQMTLGETYLNQGNFTAARNVISAALATGEAMEHPETMQTGYELLAKIHDRLGNPRLAYSYLNQYQNISDSLYNIEQQKSIEELTIIHETEQKEAALALQSEQIINLNQAVRIQSLRKTLFGAGFIAVLFLLTLTFFVFQQKLRNRTIAQRAKEAQFRQEMDFKQKELTSQTLHLVSKNTFLQDLKQKLEASQSSPATFEKESNQILSSLKLEPELDKDWEMFKSYFNEIHNDFDQKLLTVCPDITDNEMRLACLIKMKLNTAEIGAMLHVMPESIRKSKYRLKKKLELAKDQELYQYLLEL
jgi:tetratricopeptide (TPR) repeat protein